MIIRKRHWRLIQGIAMILGGFVFWAAIVYSIFNLFLIGE